MKPRLTKRRIWMLILATGLCIVVVLTRCRQRPDPRVREEVLHVLGRGSEIIEACSTSDGFRVAWLQQDGPGYSVVVDGQPGPQHECVSSFTFSPDGQRTAYVAGDGIPHQPDGYPGERDVAVPEQEGRWCVVVDDQAGPEYDRVSDGSVCFSPDSKRVGYLARMGDKWFAVIDGVPGPAYDQIRGWRRHIDLDSATEYIGCFSRDSKRVAYARRIGDKWSIVIDGQPGPAHDQVASVIFSADGESWAYIAWNETTGRSCVVLDGESGPEYKAVFSEGLMITDDKQLSYAAMRGSKFLVVTNGQVGPEYDRIYEVDFSPNGKRTAYSAQKDGKLLLVADNKVEPGHEGFGEFVFSPNSQRLAYLIHKGEKSSVMVDNEPGRFHDGVGDITFSPDSSTVAYVAQKRKRRLVVEGLRLTLEEHNPWSLVVDGRSGPDHDDIRHVVFSPDSSRLVYAAGKGEKNVVVVDGRAGKEYDVIVCGPVFREDGRVEYVAQRGDALYRVTVEPEVTR